MFKVLMTVLSVLFVALVFLESEGGERGRTYAEQIDRAREGRATWSDVTRADVRIGSLGGAAMAGGPAMAEASAVNGTAAGGMANTVTVSAGAAGTPAVARVERSVSVMAGPSLGTQVIGRLVAGQQVRTAGEAAPGWQAVILPGLRGYVPAAAMSQAPRAADRPADQPQDARLYRAVLEDPA